MSPVQAARQSKTTLLISKYLLPLIIMTILAGLSSMAMFLLTFYPAQDRLEQSMARYQTAQQTQSKTQTALQTQGVLSTTWKAFPDYRTFTELSLDIADLAKRNHVHIPGMGYDFKPLSNKLAAKGTFAFEAEGPYQFIRKFIFELEKRWPYLFIEKLSVEASKKEQGVIFKLTVSTFLKEFPEPVKRTKT
jgi:hypothetical protein